MNFCMEGYFGAYIIFLAKLLVTIPSYMYFSDEYIKVLARHLPPAKILGFFGEEKKIQCSLPLPPSKHRTCYNCS